MIGFLVATVIAVVYLGAGVATVRVGRLYSAALRLFVDEDAGAAGIVVCFWPVVVLMLAAVGAVALLGRLVNGGRR